MPQPFEADLDELAEGMAKPGCRFDIRYEDVFMALLPIWPYSGMPANYIHFGLSALWPRVMGRWQTCCGIARANCLPMSRCISQLVRVAILQMNLVPFCDGLHWEKWSDAQLAEFQQSIELIDLLKAPAGVPGERNVNMWFEQPTMEQKTCGHQ